MSSNNIYRPYTYLIGWSKHNMWYYGRRTAKNCNPKELWVSYFTSSKYVKRFTKQFGQPDIIQIRKIFTTAIMCCEWETKVLKRIKADISPFFLNESVATGTMNTTNKAPAKTISGENLGLVDLSDARWASGEIVGYHKGISNNCGSKIKKIRSKKYWSSTSDKSKENNKKSALKWHADPIKNRKHRESLKTDEYRNKQSKNATKLNNERIANGTHQTQQLLTCPYCGFTCNVPNAKRHHFEKCKNATLKSLLLAL